MPQNLTQKIINSHHVEGSMTPGEEIALRIDQTLTQDATGTLVMLELEAMDIERVETELSVQYVDHNLIQEDFKNPDDHRFLDSACRRFGVWYSAPGNGVSHPVHQERFGVPGKTMVGSDSHTPAAGGIGMLAIGAGGIEVALAMAGRPLYVKMPKVIGVELVGELPPFVSAKDVVLEMLRRHDVDGALNCVIEYFGPGVSQLSAMDRHVIANMGTEMGATSSIFPSDENTRAFLAGQGREDAWQALAADEGAEYDRTEQLDLSKVEPMIAMPSSPGNVKKVADVAGKPIGQAYVGSSANPGYRDFAVVAGMVKDRKVHHGVSLDVNPTSRQILENLVADGHLMHLIHAGARIHQAGCNGCIGMGQAPATETISLRTVPRNFPGRSGTREDKVCLVSPETAAASALRGEITDPRTLDMDAPKLVEPDKPIVNEDMFQSPLDEKEARQVKLIKGPNIVSLPEFDAMPDSLETKVLLTVDDDISTDEIMPAGARVLPYRSNIPAISEFCFEVVDESYSKRAAKLRDEEGKAHTIVAGENYGQGSSREHAALAPRYLGLRLVVAVSFARIHWQNLCNFGVLPLTFVEKEDRKRLERDAEICIKDVAEQLRGGPEIEATVGGENITLHHALSERQVDVILAGGLIPWMRGDG